jgi:hypothetical protein
MKIILVDCLGCVFDQSFYKHIDEPGISEPDKFRLKYETPNRTLEQQTTSNDYYLAVDKYLDKTDYDSLYFIGTNGEVLSASYLIRKEYGSYSNPVGYINTLDKFNFAKDFLMNDGESLTIISDQYYGPIFGKMCKKFNSKIHILEIKRKVKKDEIPDVKDIEAKHGIK